MELALRELQLPLRHPFTISKGTTTVQKNLLVELSQDGMSGYGEAASSGTFDVPLPSIIEAIESCRALIEKTRLGDPAELWERLFPQLDHNRFALCAIDEAAHDLWGKLQRKPVWKLWGLDLASCPLSDYTIGIDSIEKMVTKMQEFDGWPIYKIKLGTDRDLEIVRALREHTTAIFRIDANTAWTAEQTIAIAPELEALGVEFLEQPLPGGDWEGMRKVHAECALPVIADESCIVEEDVERCADCFSGINIKLTKAGGMTPARRMIARARELNLQVMVGCMTESTVGISAIGQLLPLLDHVDMDGAVLIAKDVATGVHLEKGRAVFPETNGNGVELL